MSVTTTVAQHSQKYNSDVDCCDLAGELGLNVNTSIAGGSMTPQGPQTPSAFSAGGLHGHPPFPIRNNNKISAMQIRLVLGQSSSNDGPGFSASSSPAQYVDYSNNGSVATNLLVLGPESFDLCACLESAKLHIRVCLFLVSPCVVILGCCGKCDDFFRVFGVRLVACRLGKTRQCQWWKSWHRFKCCPAVIMATL